MPPRYLPRLPCEEDIPEPTVYSIVVSSCIGSGDSIERPVTVDTAIDRLFLPCRGALLYSASARTDLQGGGLRVRERSTQGYPTQRSPSFELIREVPAGLQP